MVGVNMAIVSRSQRKYDAPPILEVVCGVHFDEIPGLDPVMIGRFWNGISARFPKRELRPAVQPSSEVGREVVVNLLPPLRALLISPDEATLLQVQPNRFYFNWRRQRLDAPYPRFSDHDGAQGVGSMAVAAYTEFASFCESALVRPVATNVELAKVDLFVRGIHWSDFGELVELLPWLESFRRFSKAGNPAFAVRFEEHRPAGLLSVALSPAVHATTPAVKLEARLTAPVSGASELPEAFTTLNAELNEVFEDLIPEQVRAKRFMRRGGSHA